MLSMTSSTSVSTRTPERMGLAPMFSSLDAFGGCPGVVMNYASDEEVFGEGEAADFVYKVVSGSVRTFKILSDGRRQIEGFHFAGDVFGLEVDDSHRLSAEAISGAQVVMTRRTHLENASRRDCTAARELWALTFRDLERARAQMLLLGRKSATEKVASFLLEMAKRFSGRLAVELPMSRMDIADYLGLTIETVSRTLSLLERRGAIALPSSRRIELRDRGTLNALAA